MDHLCIDRVVVVLKQKTAYEMRISDWSSDVCSSDLTTSVEGDRMDKTLYIHIGTGKTGTTAIQDFLSVNNERLERTLSLRYIQSVLRSGNHHAACLNRSEERRVGKEWVSRCRSRWSP